MKNIDKKNLLAIGLLVLAIILVVSSYILNSINKDTESKIYIVTNYNDFYTVDSCLYRLMTYINSNDNESLSLLLDDKYKKENNITGDIANLFNIPENATFTSRKMYYQKLSNNITKYYVYGYVFPNLINQSIKDSINNKTDRYFIVYLDSKNLTFYIEPYDGDIFIGGEINEQ